jgi:DNA-binding transcriptional regulator YhcF (GntR family)
MAQSPSSTASAAEPAFDLARADDLPIGSQLAWRLRVLIASGALRAGDRLPGVRELAGGTSVNVNTARAVYGRLEDDGLIVSRQGHGTFVADAARAFPELDRLAAEAVESARANGVDPRDLARAIYAGSATELAGLEPPPRHASGDPDADRAAAPLPDTESDERPGRNELRRQIARLEAQLASYPDARKAGEPTHPLLQPKGHVADMAELEQTRDELIERLKRARENAEHRGDRQREARTRLEGMTTDPAGHKWETVSRQDIGEPGCATWEVTPKWGPVGVLMNWWRVKVSSGCPPSGPFEAAIGDGER